MGGAVWAASLKKCPRSWRGESRVLPHVAAGPVRTGTRSQGPGRARKAACVLRPKSVLCTAGATEGARGSVGRGYGMPRSRSIRTHVSSEPLCLLHALPHGLRLPGNHRGCLLGPLPSQRRHCPKRIAHGSLRGGHTVQARPVLWVSPRLRDPDHIAQHSRVADPWSRRPSQPHGSPLSAPWTDPSQAGPTPWAPFVGRLGWLGVAGALTASTGLR